MAYWSAPPGTPHSEVGHQRREYKKKTPSKSGEFNHIQWLREEVGQLEVCGESYEFGLLLNNKLLKTSV